jgi:hypothetical protein
MALMDSTDYEQRLKSAESGCRAMSSAVPSVRILREGIAQLNDEHHTFGAAICIEAQEVDKT